MWLFLASNEDEIIKTRDKRLPVNVDENMFARQKSYTGWVIQQQLVFSGICKKKEKKIIINSRSNVENEVCKQLIIMIVQLP